MKTTAVQRTRRATAIGGAVVALTMAGAGIAQASGQDSDLAPNQAHAYNTWFFGRTPVCFTNTSTTDDATVYWESSFSHDILALAKGSQPSCINLSFVGFQLYVKNASAHAHVQVTFPFGP